VLDAALRNATPIIEVKPRRVGGATYQVPVEIRGDRRMSLGVRWLVQAARKRQGKSMSEKLAFELVDAMNGLGAAVKRREGHAQDGRGQQGLQPLQVVGPGKQ
jgi:small subunit ribosomal protein S7